MTTPVDELLNGRYQVDHVLGRGATADVFRARDLTCDRLVAVKLVRSADPALARRLAREARALARLEHTSLVRLLDAGVQDDQAYLVMELVSGPTLAARLRSGPLSPARTAAVGHALASALAYVHNRGIVHRDLKPANVLLGPGPRVRLADFGIALLADTSLQTVTGTTLGTAGYMAPEQLEHHVVGAEADTWSLGIILLECLAGRRVYQGTATQVVARRLAGPPPLPHNLPTPWRLLLQGMLDQSPARRLSCAHAAELLTSEPFTEPWDPGKPDYQACVGGLDPEADSTENNGRPQPDNAESDVPTLAPGESGFPSTMVAPLAPVHSSDRGARRRRLLRPVGVLAGIVLAAAGLSAWMFSAGGSTPRRINTPPVASSVPTLASTSTTLAPTTTLPTASSAAAKLLADLEGGVATGAITSDANRTIRGDLNRALSAASSGDQGQEDSAIAAMNNTITNEIQTGSMTSAEGSILLADASQLANALGVPATAPTMPTPSVGGTGDSGSGNSGGGNSPNST
jgi:eukaryotic-like serine/threonine-protein kinase